MLGYLKNSHFCSNFCKLDFAIAVASIYVSETHSKHTLEQDGQPKTADSIIQDRCGNLINVNNPVQHIQYTKHGRLVYWVTEPITVRTPSICIHNFDLNSEFAWWAIWRLWSYFDRGTDSCVCWLAWFEEDPINSQLLSRCTLDSAQHDYFVLGLLLDLLYYVL